MELRLRAADQGKQPYLAASLFAHESQAGTLPADWPPALHQRFAEGLDILRRSFAVPPDEHPLWLFRAGVSPGLPPPYQHTMRHPLARILHIEPPRHALES